MRVGILGGVFNPPHLGHAICAVEAIDQLELDVLRMVPVRRAPHRAIEPEPGPDVRTELCEAAAGVHAAIEVSRIELDRDGPSYTADTLGAMREAGPDDELILVIGGDQAVALASWREPAKVLHSAGLAIADRGRSREQIESGLALVGGAGAEPFFLDMPRIGISSSMVRERIAAGKPFRHLVSDPVGDLIAERGLYQPTGSMPEAGR